jgi:hypothetical protein
MLPLTGKRIRPTKVIATTTANTSRVEIAIVRRFSRSAAHTSARSRRSSSAFRSDGGQMTAPLLGAPLPFVPFSR